MKRTVVWVVLLALTGWSLWRFMQPAVAPQMHAPLTAPDISKIDAIELAPMGGPAIHLKKERKKWMLVGKPDVPANEESVRHFLDDLAAMRVIRVVTHTHTHDDELGMNHGTKLTLLDQTDNALFTLTVGKQGSDLISTYVRVGQAPDVLAVDKALVWQVKRGSNAWKALLPEPDDTNQPAKKIKQDTKKTFPLKSS